MSYLNNINNLAQGQNYKIDEKPAPQSPFDSLAAAVSWMRDIQQRISVLADRIAGPGPKQEAHSKLAEIAGGGLIDGMERQIESVRAILDDISADLGRIENRL